MQIQRIGVTAVTALLLVACGSEEEAETPAFAGSGTLSVFADAPAPAHGGTVVAAGPQYVEVLPHEDGTVQAYVVTPEPPPRAQTRITVHLTGDDGERHPVVLTWDPSAAAYRGRLRRVQPAPGPIEVTVVVAGERYVGDAPEVVLIAPPAPSVVVEAERPSADVHVVAPSGPDVHVVAPSPPSVVVHAPAPPRPHIVVQPPTPPSVVVHGPRPPRVRVHHDNGRHRGHRRHGRGRVRVRVH